MSSTIVCIGDSLVNTSFLSHPMHNRLARIYGNTSVVNLGVSGDDISEVSARKSAVLQYNPALIIVQVGTNDITFGTATAEVIESALAALYNYFKNTAKAAVWVFTCPPSEFEWDGNGTTNPHQFYDRYSVRTAVNAWIRAIPANVDAVFDAWTAVRDPSNPIVFAPEYRQLGNPGDTTNHYNDTGLEAVLELLP